MKQLLLVGAVLPKDRGRDVNEYRLDGTANIFLCCNPLYNPPVGRFTRPQCAPGADSFFALLIFSRTDKVIANSDFECQRRIVDW